VCVRVCTCIRAPMHTCMRVWTLFYPPVCLSVILKYTRHRKPSYHKNIPLVINCRSH